MTENNDRGDDHNRTDDQRYQRQPTNNKTGKPRHGVSPGNAQSVAG